LPGFVSELIQFYRNRALAAFKSKPGADLIFSCDEDEVFGFLAEEVGSKEAK
jgi:hypothetical protein